jgi:serine/threonine protein phosphatase PrpC
MVTVRAAGATDVGRVRQGNEDDHLVGNRLFAVADGMGGHQGGEVASAMAIDALRSADLDGPDPLEVLVSLIRAANHEVLRRGVGDPALRGMGTTLTAVVIEDDEAGIAHVGDSRAYLFREGRLSQVTEDHTLVQELVRQGRLTSDEAEYHPQRSVLVRALGVDDDVEVDTIRLPLREDDVLVLCSDGLNGMLDDEEIREILAGHAEPEAAAFALVEAAVKAGGIDNVTVVVIRVEPDAESAGPGAAVSAVMTAPGTARVDAPSGAGPSATATQVATRLAAAPSAAAGSDATVTMAKPPEVEEPDDEYAPAGRRRRRWIPWVVGVVVVLVAAALAGRSYVHRQWYVGVADDRVAIYQGIPVTVLGYHLSSVDELTDLPASSAEGLPVWSGLADGITVASRAEAEELVADLRVDLAAPAEGPSHPSPTPPPTGGASPDSMAPTP